MGMKARMTDDFTSTARGDRIDWQAIRDTIDPGRCGDPVAWPGPRPPRGAIGAPPLVALPVP